jgi:hypothetical protein
MDACLNVKMVVMGYNCCFFVSTDVTLPVFVVYTNVVFCTGVLPYRRHGVILGSVDSFGSIHAKYVCASSECDSRSFDVRHETHKISPKRFALGSKSLNMTFTMPSLLALNIVGALLILPYSSAESMRRKPKQYERSFPESSPRYTIDDMTCHFIQQPLNHFLPNSPTYLEDTVHTTNSQSILRLRFSFTQEMNRLWNNILIRQVSCGSWLHCWVHPWFSQNIATKAIHSPT